MKKTKFLLILATLAVAVIIGCETTKAVALGECIASDPTELTPVTIPEGAFVIYDSESGVDRIGGKTWGDASFYDVKVGDKYVKKYDYEFGGGQYVCLNLTETLRFDPDATYYLSVYADRDFKFAHTPGEGNDILTKVKKPGTWQWVNVKANMKDKTAMGEIAFSSDTKQSFYIDHIYILGKSAQKVNPLDEGLKLVWADEFDYDGVPDVSKWKYQTGSSGWGNNELQNYLDNTKEAKTAVVSDGSLKIKAFREDGKWVSARMNSKTKLRYGYIEASMKITDKRGAWPAFWMMPNDSVYGGWPNSGEIDIMENAPVTFGQGKIFSTVHAAGHFAGGGIGLGSANYEKLSEEWHTCAIRWTEDSITTYFDGYETGSYENDGTTKNYPYIQDFYIILNLAIGGNLGGSADAANLDAAQLEVDYVRWYQ